MDCKSSKKINPEKALILVQNICSKQEKCCSEIREKLNRWQLSESEQDSIITSLRKDKFIDEDRYVNFFVNDKLRFNKWGRIKIAYQLRAKEIPTNLIERYTSAIDRNEYREVLDSLLMQKFKSVKEDDVYKLKSKLLRFAQNRGFETELSFEIINKLLEK